ncbi:hypothetical protein LTR95_013188, partial [Oleoguttula sp. CCFEE 5521]
MAMDRMQKDMLAELETHVRSTIARYYAGSNYSGISLNPPDAVITPRLTRTEVHHDSLPHVSLTLGHRARYGEPLKLWILWPSTEVRHLARYYTDTSAA